MKRLLIVLFAFWGAMSFGQADKTGSPYFIISSKANPGDFPLLGTYADVKITGPMADVTVTQKYTNKGEVPIEAVYIFPASTRAAVYHMEMHIGERIVKAEVKEKNKARATYEKAKSEGKRTSLLEEHRPNVFQMNVANILPGETVEVLMKYVEYLIPEDQEYSFVYPTVVGPRYGSASYNNNGYTKSGVPPKYKFGIKVRLDMPVEIRDITCNTHQVNIKGINSPSGLVKLAGGEGFEGDRDFILTFRLAGDDIQAGVLTYDTGDEKFFLVQVEGPELSCKPEITPREYIFIVDVSGSMSGYPLKISKKLMNDLLRGMRPTDKFNILFFAGSAFMLNNYSLNATKDNIERANNVMESQHGGGSTQILPAIKKALKIPKKEGFARSFVIITDGYVVVEEEVFKLISGMLGTANFFSFGIGSSVNRHLIEGMAHVGSGYAFIAKGPNDAEKTAAKLKKCIESPVLTDIRFHAKGMEVYDLVYGGAADLFGQKPVYYFGKYRNATNASITITGNKGDEKWSKTLDFTDSSKDLPALKYLWAREKIRINNDFNFLNTNEQRIAEITQIGLKYNLLTKYTSFVAVDQEVVNPNHHIKKVKQPLPIPQGVSNMAIGFEMEIEDLVTTGQTSRMIIDISTKDKKDESMMDAITSTVVGNMDKEKIKSLIGKAFSLRIVNGKVEYRGSHQGIIHLVRLINAALSKLGISFDEGVIFRINCLAISTTK